MNLADLVLVQKSVVIVTLGTFTLLTTTMNTLQHLKTKSSGKSLFDLSLVLCYMPSYYDSQIACLNGANPQGNMYLDSESTNCQLLFNLYEELMPENKINKIQWTMDTKKANGCQSVSNHLQDQCIVSHTMVTSGLDNASTGSSDEQILVSMIIVMLVVLLMALVLFLYYFYFVVIPNQELMLDASSV